MTMFIASFTFILVASVAIVLYIGGVSATNNGWRELAARYAHRGPLQGRALRFVSASLNKVYLQRLLVVTPTKGGLGLAGILPFRPSHPTLLVPWSDVKSELFDDDYGGGYRLSFTSFPEMKLEWSQRVHADVTATLQPAWSEAQSALAVTAR